MCDFKPGDEVVCVDASLESSPVGFNWANPLALGETYTIAGLGIDRRAHIVVAFLAGHPNTGPVTGADFGFMASRFRKVERENDSLSIEAFLTIKPGFEEPKRAPAKKVPA